MSNTMRSHTAKTWHKNKEKWSLKKVVGEAPSRSVCTKWPEDRYIVEFDDREDKIDGPILM